MNFAHLTPLQRFAREEHQSLLCLLREAGATFVECDAQTAAGDARSVSHRYDVHARDAYLAHGFLASHAMSRVPATFFLHHGFAAAEVQRNEEFIQLSAAIRRVQDATGVRLSIGVHDSPVDRHLIWSRFDGNERAYAQWLRSGTSLEFFERLESDAQLLDSFNREVEGTFFQAVSEFRRQLGACTLAASHGGPLSQILRKQIDRLGPVGQVIRGLLAENWLSAQRLGLAELKYDVEQFKQSVPRWASVTEGGGNLQRMVRDIQRHLDLGHSIGLLIHPYSWERDRNAEWSDFTFNGTRFELGGHIAQGSPVRTTILIAPSLAVATAQMKKRGLLAADCLWVAPEIARAPISDANDLQALGALGDVVSGRCAHFDPKAVLVSDNYSRCGSFVTSTLGLLVQNSPRSLSPTPPGERGREGKFQKWLSEAYRLAGREGGLTLGELNYFMFSSSPRAELLSSIASALGLSDRGITMVDHGAGIGLFALVVSQRAPVSHLICTEVKANYIDLGKSLWSSMSPETVVEYANLKAEEYTPTESADLVFFGHLLYRIPRELRRPTIESALRSLSAKGCVVVNEIMNRPDLSNHYRAEMVTSDELLSYVPEGFSALVARQRGETLDFSMPDQHPPSDFAGSENMLILLPAQRASRLPTTGSAPGARR